VGERESFVKERRMSSTSGYYYYTTINRYYYINMTKNSGVNERDKSKSTGSCLELCKCE
tara:strand:- start:59 stop:235 length:177 start_codon:yes stop_codon:yes gene_type:complete